MPDDLTLGRMAVAVGARYQLPLKAGRAHRVVAAAVVDLTEGDGNENDNTTLRPVGVSAAIATNSSGVDAGRGARIEPGCVGWRSR